LGWFTNISIGIGSGGLPIWWWDPGSLLQMMRLINKVMSRIGVCHCRDIVRGVVELCSIWRGRFSLTILRIHPIRGLAEFDFTEMPGRDMIQDNEHCPLMDLNLGV
jgi:hypothetical protein